MRNELSSSETLSLYDPKFGHIHTKQQNSWSCSSLDPFGFVFLFQFNIIVGVIPKEDRHPTLMYEFSSTLKEKEENWCVPSDLDKCPRFEGRNSTIRRTDRLRELNIYFLSVAQSYDGKFSPVTYVLILFILCILDLSDKKLFFQGVIKLLKKCHYYHSLL